VRLFSPPGTHSVYLPCFGNSRAVTRRITMDLNIDGRI
jgi:hypothetical protein